MNLCPRAGGRTASASVELRENSVIIVMLLLGGRRAESVEPTFINRNKQMRSAAAFGMKKPLGERSAVCARCVISHRDHTHTMLCPDTGASFGWNSKCGNRLGIVSYFNRLFTSSEHVATFMAICQRPAKCPLAQRRCACSGCAAD